jgi:hypothetical protein
MGWRGALRAVAAAQRAAEREAMRQFRQQQRETKQEMKREALRQAAYEVEQYENWVERIMSVHRDVGATWNWTNIADTPAPTAPQPTAVHEASAKRALDSFRPSWVDRLLRRVDRKRGSLEAAVEQGGKRDADANAEAGRVFAEHYQDWVEMCDLARRILAMDVTAFKEAVEELSPLAELSELGSRIDFVFHQSGVATVTLTANGEVVIPGAVKSLLQSGKLSTKKMPQGRFYELYQDYVVGAVLRVARELFALLPLHTVHVTATGHMLEPSTGHMKDRTILSVVIPRQTIAGLNFGALDPSDGLRNFNHRMDFKKTTGFLPIEPIVPSA